MMICCPPFSIWNFMTSRIKAPGLGLTALEGSAVLAAGVVAASSASSGPALQTRTAAAVATMPETARAASSTASFLRVISQSPSGSVEGSGAVGAIGSSASPLDWSARSRCWYLLYR